MIIYCGNEAVTISEQNGIVRACFYVNARDGNILNADITPLAWKGKTIAGAKKWAEKHFTK